MRLAVSFILDKRCNKKCDYCEVTKGENHVLLSDEEIFSNFDKCISRVEFIATAQGVLSLIFPQILGGEPALWSEWLTKKIQERLSCYKEYRVFTNGTESASQDIWKADPKCNRAIHILDWHGKKIEDAGERSYNLVIVTKKDIPFLADFIKQNPRVFPTPCISPSAELNITWDDYIEILKITKENDGWVLDNADFVIAENNAKEAKRLCVFNKYCTAEVDCSTFMVSACCHGWSHPIPLDDFWGIEKPPCNECNFPIL